MKPQKRSVTPSVLKLLGVLHLDPINLLIHNEVKRNYKKTLLRARKRVDPINLFDHNEVKRMYKKAPLIARKQVDPIIMKSKHDKRTHLKTRKQLLKVVCITLKSPNK